MQVTVNGVRVAQLADGQCFGERALISAHAKRRATITTRTYCQLFLLSRTAMQAAFAMHPHYWATLCQRAEMQWNDYSNAPLPSAHARGYAENPDASGGEAPFSVERTLPKSVTGSTGSQNAERCALQVGMLCHTGSELMCKAKRDSIVQRDRCALIYTSRRRAGWRRWFGRCALRWSS